MIANGSLALILLLVVLSGVALIWPRPFAALFLGIGVLLALYLAASVAFNWSFPYQTWNISVYLVLFCAVIFSMSGLIGVAAWMRRRTAGA